MLAETPFLQTLCVADSVEPIGQLWLTVSRRIV